MGGVSRKSLESGLKKVTVWTGLNVHRNSLLIAYLNVKNSISSQNFYVDP